MHTASILLFPLCRVCDEKETLSFVCTCTILHALSAQS